MVRCINPELIAELQYVTAFQGHSGYQHQGHATDDPYHVAPLIARYPFVVARRYGPSVTATFPCFQDRVTAALAG